MCVCVFLCVCRLRENEDLACSCKTTITKRKKTPPACGKGAAPERWELGTRCSFLLSFVIQSHHSFALLSISSSNQQCVIRLNSTVCKLRSQSHTLLGFRVCHNFAGWSFSHMNEFDTCACSRRETCIVIGTWLCK